MTLGLWEILVETQADSTSVREHHYIVHPIPEYPRHFFGRNGGGAPCLLLGAVDQESVSHPPIQLEGLTVLFNIPCAISLPDGESREDRLSVVRCVVEGEDTQRYFAHACESVVQIVGSDPTDADIRQSVQRLVEIFQRLSQPPVRSLTGLIGELCVIRLSRNPVAAIRSWRAEDSDRYDFASQDVRIEVKASTARERYHILSLEQCAPPPGTIGILASLFIERLGGGKSMSELITEIERSVEDDPELILKLHRTIANSLGDALATAMATRFDFELARSSLQLYRIADIPAIRQPIPDGVSKVRFTSDLSITPHASVRSLMKDNPTIGNLLPHET